MNVKITPTKLIGRIKAPSSKSFSHRMIIAAALAGGVSEISNINPSVDIEATASAMTALGAAILGGGSVYTVKGIDKPAQKAEIDCHESGSTLRFIIPIAAALGVDTLFTGCGKLPERPITTYIREFAQKGVKLEICSHKPNTFLPLKSTGKLRGGDFHIEGDVSSQFITGLLYALPLCDEDSRIILTSPLESKPYVDMTIAALDKFGITVTESVGENGCPVYSVKGGQKYTPADCSVEGDYSQAAFFFTANALGSEITVDNLNPNSVQGDKKILEIIEEIGYNKVECGKYKPFTADAADIPDIVPILTVLGCFTQPESTVVNAKRLKIKESDRLKAIADAMNAIGGNVTAGDDFLRIVPVKNFCGGFINGCNDHRIVMASAIASTMSDGCVTISDCEAVSKSYPSFWDDFKSLGGVFEFTE